MAKKRRRRRPSLLTKGINIGIMLLAFSRPLFLLLERGGPGIGKDIVTEATAGMVGGGGFNKDLALAFYGPMVAAIVLKKAISMVRRTVRI